MSDSQHQHGNDFKDNLITNNFDGVQYPGNAINEEKQAQKSKSLSAQNPEYNIDRDPGPLESFWMVVKLSVPPIISMFFFFFVQLVSTYFIGNLNDPLLIGGVGMGNMLINVLCFAVIWGLNGALETLVSQANGFKKYKLCGTYLNRGRMISSAVMIPLIIIFALSDKILIAIKQDVQISTYACRYTTMLIPGCWAMGLFDATRKFLNAQGRTDIPVYVQLVTMIFHILWCWIFITKLDMKLDGAALAMNITYVLNFVLADGYITIFKACPETWQPLTRDAFKDWGRYLRIGIPGAMMLCFEWWAFELLAIFSGYLGVIALAAEVVIINLVTFIFMLPLGISYAASSLVGNAIGQGNIRMGKRFAWYVIIFDIFCTVIILIILVSAQDQLASLFTKEENVVAEIRYCIYFLLIYIFFDTIHGVQSGIIRGLGRQAYGGGYTLICYYVFGMPLALIFGFVCKMGISGLWLGFSVACIILDIGFYFIISCANWEQISLNQQKAMAEEEEISKSINESHLDDRQIQEIIETPRMDQKKRILDSRGQELGRA